MLEELKKAESEARLSLEGYKSVAEKTRRPMIRKVEAEIEEHFGPELRERAAKLNAAIAAVRAEEDRLAKAGNGALYPLGTRFEKWEAPGWAYERGPAEIVAYGVYEIINADSEHSDNIADYRRADIGKHVIRLLKKDGKPSKKYEQIRIYGGDTPQLPYGWKLTGETKQEVA